VDGTFIPWSLKLRERLLQDFPLPDGITQIPEEVLLRPKWELEFIDSHPGQASDFDTVDTVQDNPPDGLLPIRDSVTVTVESNSRITPASHWQDVRRVSFIAEPISYQPGDVLTIYPKNFPVDVDNFLQITGWSSIADVPLKFSLVESQNVSAAESPPPLPLPNLPSSDNLNLRMLLTNHLDIMAIPRRSFFAALAHFTSDPFQKERLLEFTNPEYLDELYDYTTRPRRSILEVLQEFETVKLPWQWVCSIIPPLRGRQFSIASGGEASKAAEGSTRIELLVAIVKYRTVIKRIRQGVCTRYITSLKPGQKLNVTLQRGSLGLSITDFTRPVVLVGPGTGVAPIRSLIYERLLKRREAHSNEEVSQQVPLKNILFFGCRNEDADYFFKDEWESLAAEGKLDVFTAFSRDQVSGPCTWFANRRSQEKAK
jgi:sulfite reductase alpha subunit-like flavoprotein